MIATYSVQEGILKIFNETLKQVNENRKPLEKKITKSGFVENAMIKFIEKNQDKSND